ncbi:hypothetical protein H5410_004149, partial [Solanum commersonii]
AFPIGSPLVPDVSRAVLNVTEGEKMGQIERAWFGESTCSDSSTSLSSNRLGLDSFWRFFVMAVIAAVLALIIFLMKFAHKHWHIIRRSNLSLCEISRILARNFDTKDYSSNTFKKSELRDIVCGVLMVTTGPPCPSNSSHTEQMLHFSWEEGDSPSRGENEAVNTKKFEVPQKLGAKALALKFIGKSRHWMSEGFVWIVTDAMADQLNLMDVSVIESMKGVIGVKPYVPKSKKVEDFIQR